ncbi:MAG: ABC transporter ATP-binding protein/permease [Selenomonadaceae bacterium]|nr:ABC transporter ATP-binding protein/permease [Selenomonadaceae bacterium]
MRKDFWRLFKGYWVSDQKWKGLGLLAIVIALNFATVYLLVQINTWYNDFYNALQAYDQEQFLPLIGKFTALAFIYIIIAVYAIYLRQELQIKWRTWMTDRYLDAWTNNQTFYRLQVERSDTDNPDQRISEDISQFVSITLALLVGFLKQLTTLAAFGIVLWNLSGVMNFSIGSHEFQIYGYMLWVTIIYAGIGTIFAHLVGRRLIGLNFDQQRYEADFRFNMMRVRENSESIAFYRGEEEEVAGFRERFSYVVKNFWQLMKATRLLNFYVNGYGQLAVIVPIILAAPRYFSNEIALGGLMQTISAFGRVQDALSYFVDAYDSIAQLAAVTKRLSTFTAHMEDVNMNLQSKVRIQAAQDSKLELEDLSIALPNGKILIESLFVDVKKGNRLLVTGTSGCGKSTLLRTLAGIWRFGSGAIKIPAEDRAMFLPQKPYLPLGSLRRAIAYPATAEDTPAAREYLKKILESVKLSNLEDRLDDVDDWSRILSLGEQQRLAFARVLLARPDWLFLDEATSALDEDMEKDLYDLLRTELPEVGIVSVGHRSSLFDLHDAELHIDSDFWNLRTFRLKQ